MELSLKLKFEEKGLVWLKKLKFPLELIKWLWGFYFFLFMGSHVSQPSISYLHLMEMLGS